MYMYLTWMNLKIARLLVFCSQAESTCIQELEIKLSFREKKFRFVCTIVCLIAALWGQCEIYTYYMWLVSKILRMDMRCISTPGSD